MNINIPNVVEPYSVVPSDDSYRYVELTGEEYVELKFETAEYKEIPTGSSITFESRNYYVNRPQDVKIVHNKLYEYTVRFEAVWSVLKYRPYANPDDGRVDFPVTGDLSEHVSMLIRSMWQYTPFAWTAGSVMSNTEEKCISYGGITMYEALELIAQEYETEFEFAGTTLNVGKIEYNGSSPLTLEYGKGKGIKSGIQRSNLGDSPKVYGLIVKGSSQNLNTSSNQQASYGDKTLHMPAYVANPLDPNDKRPMIIGYDAVNDKFAYATGFYESGSPSVTTYTFMEESGFMQNNAKYFHIPVGGRSIYYTESGIVNPAPVIPNFGSKIEIADLSHIYPQLTHTITNVTTRTVQDSRDGESYTEYTIYIAANTDPNYNDCLIPGNNLSIVFQSGALAGKEFDVNYEYSTHKFVIVSKFIDDERMPGGVFIPATGDTFKAFNCMLPEAYIRNDSNHTGAEWDMARESVRQLYELMDNNYTYKFDVDGIYTSSLSDADFAKIIPGSYIRLVHTYGTGNPNNINVLIRIMSVKQPLNTPRWVTITVADRPSVRVRRRQQLQAASDDETSRNDASSSVYDERSRRIADVDNTNSRVNALPTYEDAYSELEDAGEPILVDAEKCQSMKYLEFASGDRAAGKSIVINSSYAGIETSVIINNKSANDITLTITAKNGETVVFNTADKNDQVFAGCVRKLTYWMAERVYYVTMTDIQ